MSKSIPELIMKAICWMEKVAEFPSELRATQGRLAWAIVLCSRYVQEPR